MQYHCTIIAVVLYQQCSDEIKRAISFLLFLFVLLPKLCLLTFDFEQQLLPLSSGTSVTTTIKSDPSAINSLPPGTIQCVGLSIGYFDVGPIRSLP
ncbi:hypothetical protein [Bacteroides sp.]|uniref:hypothetical protein n=1 Tax=Bacteroides sp. TaxID=29523 RepID=UPI002FCB4D10